MSESANIGAEISSPETVVNKVTSEVFINLLKSRDKSTSIHEIDINSWRAFNSQDLIINKGAGPCLILYAINSKTGEAVSGHFSNTHLNVQQRENDLKEMTEIAKSSWATKSTGNNGLIIPSAESSLVNMKGFERGYQEILQEVENMVSVHGRENISLYLFGQNNSLGKDKEVIDIQTTTKSIIKTGLKQLPILLDLNSIGIMNVNDFRNPYGSQVTDTFYDPKSKTIYVHEGDRTATVEIPEPKKAGLSLLVSTLKNLIKDKSRF